MTHACVALLAVFRAMWCVQYDDREVDVGGGGRGDDLETVRRVNQLVRQGEEEDAWWEDNKNTNLRSVRSTKLGVSKLDSRSFVRSISVCFFIRFSLQ